MAFFTKYINEPSLKRRFLFNRRVHRGNAEHHRENIEKFCVQLCKTLCLLHVYWGYTKQFRFLHKVLKGIHKDHEDCMCLYFNILIHEN